MPSLAPFLFPLLQAADSAGTRIVLEHTWLDTAAGVAQSLVSILVVVMLVMGVLLLYALKKSIDELSKLIKHAYEPLKAAIAEAREVTGEVRALAKGLKGPVEKASETITDASERVRAAMDVAEGRLARLDALVDIAQEEAEGVVIGAASLVRGLRAGGGVVRQSLGFLSRDARTRRARLAEADEEALPEEAEDEEALLLDDVADDEEEPAASPRATSDAAFDEDALHDRDDAENATGRARGARAPGDEAPRDEAPRIRRRARSGR